MLVPGMKASGFASHLSSVLSFHTTFARFMASEYRRKSEIAPAFFSQMCARLGPVMCSPGATE